jgi:hypothetical protein
MPPRPVAVPLSRRLVQSGLILFPILSIAAGTFLWWRFWPLWGLSGVPLIVIGIVWIAALIALLVGWVRPAACSKGHANALLIRGRLICPTCLQSDQEQ